MGSTKLNGQLALALIKACSNQRYWHKERAETGDKRAEVTRKRCAGGKKLVLCLHPHIQHRKSLKRMENQTPQFSGGGF